MKLIINDNNEIISILTENYQIIPLLKSNNIVITMRCTKSNTPMAFEDNINKVYGV